MSGDGYGGSGDADRSLVAVIVLSVVAMLLTPMLGCVKEKRRFMPASTCYLSWLQNGYNNSGND